MLFLPQERSELTIKENRDFQSKEGNIVKKSNALIRSRWPISSIWEPRLVALVASKVRVDDEDFKEHIFHISELTGGIRNGKLYREISDVVSRMMSRVITFYDPVNGKSWKKVNVFSMCAYEDKTATLTVQFHPAMREHFLNLKNRFTQYSLEEFFSLPSIYSQRMFELLKSWYKMGEITVDFDELCNLLDVPPSLKNYSDFRRRVLDKALADISCGLTSMMFGWEPIKSGKKVTAIRFYFEAQVIRTDGEDTPNLTDHELEMHAKLQSASNKCFEKYRSMHKDCLPKNNPKCRFCQERGRMITRRFKQGEIEFGESASV
jgi:plasmid replication initiation protein